MSEVREYSEESVLNFDKASQKSEKIQRRRNIVTLKIMMQKMS